MTAALRFLALLLLALPAQAQVVRDCDRPEAHARHVDWDEAPRSFSDGEVLMIVLDAGAPPCCGEHLMVLFPAEEGWQDCALVSQDEAHGFGDIALAGARAAYDPATGLTVSLSTGRYDGRDLEVTLDRRSGAVTAR